MKKICAIILLICMSICAISQDEANIPENLQAINIDDNSALLTWNKTEGALKYIVSYNVAMNTDVMFIESNDTSLYVDNLLSATQYLWKVRVITVDMDTSSWSNIHSFYTNGFTTDCSIVNHLTVSSFNENDLNISWNAKDNCLYWEVVCGEIGSNPDNIGKRYFTTNMEYVFSDLKQGEIYQFAVRSHCNGSFGNWSYVYANYTLNNSLLELPLEIDFSQDSSKNNIGFVSSNTNPWVIDNIINDNGISTEKYLYISNNNSQSAIFNNSKKSTSYAYIDFLVPQESTGFYLDFDYKSILQSESDGLKIFLISKGSNLDIDSTIEDIYSYGEAIYNNTQDIWKTEHIEFPNQFANSPRKIVFMWINTADCTNNSSIILKNIKITPRYCPIPDSLFATNITHNSAEIIWNLNNFQQSFNIQYKPSSLENWTTINNAFSGIVIDNLEENTLYSYRVQANCTGEQSLYSDIHSFYTEILLGIIDISSISYKTTHNSAQFTWEDKQNVKFYRIKYKEKNSQTEWNTIESPESSCNISNLAPNTEYLFKVCLVTMQDKESKYTDELPFTTLCAPISNFPYIMNDEIIYSSQKEFSNVPVCYDTSLAVVETPIFDISELPTAELSFDIISTSEVMVCISNDGGTNYKLLESFFTTNLFSNNYTHKSYILSDYIMEEKVKIKFIVNTTGADSISAKIKNIAINSICKAPNSIDIEEISYNHFTVSWESNNMTTSWVVKLYKQDNELVKTYNIPSNSCSFNALEENTIYKLVILSSCSEQTSYDSLITYITTLNSNSNICNTPINFKAYWFKTKGDETILAQWNKVSDEKIWEVWYKKAYAIEWNRKIVTLKPQFSIRNLEKGDTYEIKVRTICAPGDTSDFTTVETVHIENYSNIEEFSYLSSINVYPNPTQNMLYIESSNGEINDVTLTSTDGKIVMTQYSTILNTYNSTYNMDLSSLPKGAYILTCHINNKKFTKTIIRQ
ncbi:MAG: fibronectin type III domain-containing protein [Bacteroidales bacterium]